MNHDRYDDSYIRGILNTVKTIAMVGASAEGQPAELFRVQVSARARLPHDPGQSGPGRQGTARPARSTRKLADIPEPVDMVDIFRAANYALPIVQEALALNPQPARDLDAAHRAQRRGRRAGRSERHEGRDEPLPEDRIRPALLRDRLDRRQLAHALVQARAAAAAKACSACRSTARRSAARPTRTRQSRRRRD